MIRNIQAMRGIASFMVFCIHVLSTSPGMGADALSWFYYPLGSAGVDIFFVISGFIITTVAPRSAKEQTPVVHFATRRFVRIYPVYWVVFAIAVVASQFIFLSPPLEPRPLWMKALLLTHYNDKILAAWSLTFEVYFYAVVSILLLVSPKRITALILIWCVAMVGAIYGGAFNVQWIPGRLVLFNPLIIEFMFGVAVAIVFRFKIMPFGITAIFIGVVGLLVSGEIIRHYQMQMLPPWWRVASFGMPAMFLIYGMVAVEQMRGWTMHPLWQRLGDASYSLYIWHQLVLFSLLAMWQKYGLIHLIPGWVSLLIWATIAFGVGISAYRYIERPLTQWIIDLLDVRHRAKLAAQSIS